jgi:hypothetical protein
VYTPFSSFFSHIGFRLSRIESNLPRFDYASVAQLVEQLICNQRVGGSNPLAGFDTDCLVRYTGRYQSGQMGRAVNPLGRPFGGSNPSLPI